MGERIPSEGSVNCAGYALHEMGLVEKQGYFHLHDFLPMVESKKVREVGRSAQYREDLARNADFIAVGVSEGDKTGTPEHLAVIDKKDAKYVFQVPSWGGNEERLLGVDAVKPFLSISPIAKQMGFEKVIVYYKK